jgi:hypothetical protein
MMRKKKVPHYNRIMLPAKLNEPEMAGINGMGAAKKRPEAGLERKKGIR